MVAEHGVYDRFSTDEAIVTIIEKTVGRNKFYMEAKLTKVDESANRIDKMLKTIGANDSSIKLEVASKFKDMEHKLAKASTTVNAELVKVRDDTKAELVNVQSTT